LRTSHLNKDGSHSIFLRVIHSRKSKFFSLNITVFPKNWSEKSISVKKSDVDYIRKNDFIRVHKKRAEDIIYKYFVEHKHLSISKFAQLFENVNYNKTDIVSFVKNELSKRSLKDSTKHTYSTQLSKIEQFRKEIKIEEIDFDFILEYKKYMANKTDKPNNGNTISKSLSILKRFLNWAIERELITKNPFEKIKIERHEGNREFLSMDEVDILEYLLISDKISKNKKEILSYFLFSCYTGLRYSDIKSLKYSHFRTDIYKGKKHLKIKKKMQKPGTYVFIPIIKRSKKFLKEEFLPNEKVFKVRTNQVTNKRLKEIMQTAGINKNITTHSDRHTFATVGIDVGIPIVISKMLGHTDIKTTMIYAKIKDDVKFNELSKFDN